jgi:glycosyltransferase involved in cell wall biosynthesis
MNVFYDHQIFTEQNYGGISRYFVELFKRFDTQKEFNYLLPKMYSNNINLNELNCRNIFPFKTFQSFLPNIHFRGKFRFFNFLQYLQIYKNASKLNKAYSLEIVESNRVDLYHLTYYNDFLLKTIKSKKIPYIVTVYDLIHEKFPNFFPDYKDVISFKKRTILNANKIIAISNNTKKDLMEIYKIPEDQICVTHLASSFNSIYENQDYEKLNYDNEIYLLFVGNRSFYKNFLFFLESISSLLNSENNLFLYCVGGESINREEIAMIQKLGLGKKIKFFPNPNNFQLSEFYRKAVCFIYPSLYEGFGIPLLEAMNSNCLVACSDTSSLPEVAGNAAFYFDPNDNNSILKTVKEAVYNTTKRDIMYKKIQEQREKFSWEKTFQKTLSVYKNVLSS